ncbi:hypothetical protein SDJN02_18965, partial [Cucurbita argyrosperma subsp. argyrosperma]
MDLWIVAAATGAGYVAKYWKNQSKDGDCSLSQLSFGESNLVSPQYSNHLLSKFSQRKKRYEDVFGHGGMEGTSSDQNPSDIASVAEMACISGGFEIGKLGLFGSHQDFNVFSTPNMTLTSEERVGESSKSNTMANDIGILVCNSSGRTASSRNRSTAKGRYLHGDLIKPLTYEEDCLPAHQSSLSPCIAVELEEHKLPKGSHFNGDESVCAVSQLPFGPLSDTVSNKKTGKEWERKSRSSNKMANREHFDSKGGPDESLVLYLGFFIGIIYSFISNKREVHKLKELLKQTESLVEDLQEELEMKDSLTLKELSNDTYSNGFSEKTVDESSPKHVMDYTVNFNAEELYKHMAEQSSESIHRIEAELEAELERLGLNISTEGTERYPDDDDDDDELGPEFEEDFAEGELRNDMMSGESCGWSKANKEANESTVHSGNYTVSPRELSLRLHDVIQSRLEARIEELENTLQNNYKKQQLLNTEYTSSWLE